MVHMDRAGKGRESRESREPRQKEFFTVNIAPGSYFLSTCGVLYATQLGVLVVELPSEVMYLVLFLAKFVRAHILLGEIAQKSTTAQDAFLEHVDRWELGEAKTPWNMSTAVCRLHAGRVT